MSCLSCYTSSSKIICRHCRNLLFDGRKVKLNIEFRGIIILPQYYCSLINGALSHTNTSGNYLIKSTAGHNCFSDSAPENEHLTTQIARRVFGIKTYPNSIIFFNGKDIGYLSKRICGESSIHPHTSIYLNLAGENSELRKAIYRFTNAPEIVTEKLFRLIAFNYLTGNLHPVNECVTLHRSPYGDYVLSPAVNLYNTEIHQASSTLSLPKKTLNCFVKIGNELSLREQRIIKILGSMAANANQVKKLIDLSFLDAAFKSKYEEYFFSRIDLFTSILKY